MPKPGEMNALVRFDVRGPDANGDPLGDWLPLCQVWAKADYLRGSESAVANRLQGRQPATFVIHDEEIVRQVTGGYRLVVVEGRSIRCGETFNITAVAPDREPGFLNILGVTGGADG